MVVPCQRTFLFVIESCSSGIFCHSTFLDSPPAQQRMRPDAGWGPTGEAGWASARAIFIGTSNSRPLLETGQNGHPGLRGLSMKIPQCRSESWIEQSALSRDSRAGLVDPYLAGQAGACGRPCGKRPGGRHRRRRGPAGGGPGSPRRCRRGPLPGCAARSRNGGGRCCTWVPQQVGSSSRRIAGLTWGYGSASSGGACH
jgi:hypothetical protein